MEIWMSQKRVIFAFLKTFSNFEVHRLQGQKNAKYV